MEVMKVPTGHTSLGADGEGLCKIVGATAPEAPPSYRYHGPKNFP